MNHSPVNLFVYNRLDHTKETVAALQNNVGAKHTDLLIYSDAPKNHETIEQVKAVRQYLKTIDGFTSVTIIERAENYGLARSITEGVTETLSKHGRVIVLEDDLVTSPYFLKYMNDALELYAHTPEVMHISGYFYPVTTDTLSTDTFFFNLTSCWGWATWDRAWKFYNSDATWLLQEIKRTERLNEFDMDDTFRFSSTLRANSNGTTSTWAIKWYASVFLNHGLCLYPKQSLVDNIGHDNSGEHSNLTDIYAQNQLYESELNVKPIALYESKAARELAKDFLVKTKPSASEKIKLKSKQYYTRIKKLLS